VRKDKHPSFNITAIGLIHAPFSRPEEVPIQPSFAAGVQGQVELFPEYIEGLKDIDGFSHIELLYFFHRTRELGTLKMVRKPFLDSEPHGIFAIRYPVRPNPIGLSVVRLLSVSGNILDVEGIDVLDGTPLLDIKPHIPAFHAPGDLKSGWTEGKKQISNNEPE
jgi:tRNA-Thr(GGU) m(6)t(6)A37 methyltransferase TsaA